jgi:hypothetical protein
MSAGTAWIIDDETHLPRSFLQLLRSCMRAAQLQLQVIIIKADLSLTPIARR